MVTEKELPKSSLNLAGHIGKYIKCIRITIFSAMENIAFCVVLWIYNKKYGGVFCKLGATSVPHLRFTVLEVKRTRQSIQWTPGYMKTNK